MGIARRYDNIVAVHRMNAVAGSFRKTWAVLTVAVNCHIQPENGQQNELQEGAFYKLFKMWCPVDTDIRVGDRVVDGTTTYDVRGIKTYNYGSEANQHREVSLALGE